MKTASREMKRQVLRKPSEALSSAFLAFSNERRSAYQVHMKVSCYWIVTVAVSSERPSLVFIK